MWMYHKRLKKDVFVVKVKAEDWISKHNSAKIKRSDFGFEWPIKKGLMV